METPALSKLNAKRRRFVIAYCGEAKGNATAAAEIAGYAHPHSQGSRLLKIVEVAEAVDELHEADPLVASGEQIREFWTKVMVDAGEDTKDRIRASELLAKSRGMFVTKSKLSGTLSVAVSFDDDVLIAADDYEDP